MYLAFIYRKWMQEFIAMHVTRSACCAGAYCCLLCAKAVGNIAVLERHTATKDEIDHISKIVFPKDQTI